jgi:hypothetical protein
MRMKLFPFGHSNAIYRSAKEGHASYSKKGDISSAIIMDDDIRKYLATLSPQKISSKSKKDEISTMYIKLAENGMTSNGSKDTLMSDLSSSLKYMGIPASIYEEKDPNLMAKKLLEYSKKEGIHWSNVKEDDDIRARNIRTILLIIVNNNKDAISPDIRNQAMDISEGLPTGVDKVLIATTQEEDDAEEPPTEEKKDEEKESATSIAMEYLSYLGSGGTIVF